MAKGTEKTLKRLLGDTDTSPSSGAIAPSKEKKEVTSVTINRAHNGFTVQCGGPGTYDMKPAIAKDLEAAMGLAEKYFGETPDEDATETEE